MVARRKAVYLHRPEVLPTAPTASLAAAFAADGLSLARLTRAAALPGQGFANVMMVLAAVPNLSSGDRAAVATAAVERAAVATLAKKFVEQPKKSKTDKEKIFLGEFNQGFPDEVNRAV